MGQLLRLTFENEDHTFRILNKEPISRETRVIDLVLDGQPLRIVKADQLWMAETHAEGIGGNLVQAIAKNISLRFRI